MAFMPGKFARFRSGAQAVNGAFRWNMGFRRERLDTTNFESLASLSGNNVHTEGLTGVLDTTIQVEVYINDNDPNIFFPESQLICDLLYKKNVQLGFTNVFADVLEFQPNVAVRDRIMGTVQLQTNNIVGPAT